MRIDEKNSCHTAGSSGSFSPGLFSDAMVNAHAPTKHDQIQQRIRTQSVRAVHGRAGRFTAGIQTRNHSVTGLSIVRQRLALVIRRDSTHIVMHRGENGNWAAL